MAEKFVIEIYKKKSVEDIMKLLADPDSRLETGSGAAITAAVAASLLERAAALTVRETDNERTQYILKNAGILREYMVHLVDEDVKSRVPFNRALKEGGEREIEAARHPATAISAEVVNMMGKCIELCAELSELCPTEAKHYLGESAETALSAMKCARFYIINMADKCEDETYKFICRRENELFIGEYEPTARALCEKVMQEI